MHAINKRQYHSVFRMTNEVGNLSIRKQHEVFNQLIGIFHSLDENTNRFSFFIELKLHFFRIEIDTSRGISFCSKFFREHIEVKNFICEVSTFSFNAFLRFFVSESSVGMNDGASEPTVQYISVVVHFKHSTEAQLVFIRTKRAKEV